MKQILYNPRLIGEAELPRRHTDLTEARFKDKFVQPPWTAHWEIAPAVLDNLNRDQWLDTVRAAGKNSGAVLPEGPAAERVVLGQYPFALGQDTYVRLTRSKDPQAPLAARFFEDYNEYNSLHTVVRAGTPHPAGAALCLVFSFLEAHMGKKLYVGNLAYSVTDQTLEQLFAQHGTVNARYAMLVRLSNVRC